MGGLVRIGGGGKEGYRKLTPAGKGGVREGGGWGWGWGGRGTDLERCRALGRISGLREGGGGLVW